MVKNFQPKTPFLTVDMIIKTEAGIVLVKRRYPPPGWAIPGGFVEVGETVESAALREAKEETGLETVNVKLLGVYSDPDRDPRFHTVSIVFYGEATGDPKGGDDAAEAVAYPLDNLPEDIAFDHRKIIEDYRKRVL